MQLRLIMGFILVHRSGDLLGTSINSSLPWWAEIQHVWAGADYGKTVSGFSDNAALEDTSLSGVSNARARFNFTNRSACSTMLDMLENSWNFAEKWNQSHR